MSITEPLGKECEKMVEVRIIGKVNEIEAVLDALKERFKVGVVKWYTCKRGEKFRAYLKFSCW